MLLSDVKMSKYFIQNKNIYNKQRKKWNSEGKTEGGERHRTSAKSEIGVVLCHMLRGGMRTMSD